MKIETREDALREIMHILADCRQGKPVNFPQFLSDLETFLQNDKTVEELEKQIEELEAQIEELENQEPPITYSDVEAVEEPLIWAQHDLEDFRQTLHGFSDALKEDGDPVSWYETVKSHLNDLQYDINAALYKIHFLIG